MKTTAPFSTKYTSVLIKANRYVNLPLNFSPRELGEFQGKLIILEDDLAAPLICLIKGKWVSEIV